MAQVHYFPLNNYIIEGADLTAKKRFFDIYMKDVFAFYKPDPLASPEDARTVIDMLYQVRSTTPSGCECPLALYHNFPKVYVNYRLDLNKYPSNEIIDWFANNPFFTKTVGHVYIRHHDSGTAKALFTSHPEEARSYYSFDEYWKRYTWTDLLYREIYNKLGITPRVFETLSETDWVEGIWRT